MSLNRRPRVFIAQYLPSLDFSSAQDYGQVVFLTKKDLVRHPSPEEFNDEIVDDISAKMEDYVQGEDFIMPVISGVSTIIMGALLAHGQHKVLKWDTRSNSYSEYRIRL